MNIIKYRASDLYTNAFSKNTRKAIEQDWKTYQDYAEFSRFNPIKPSSDELLNFFKWQSTIKSHSTIVRRWATLKTAFKLMGITLSDEHMTGVSLFLKGNARVNAKKVKQAKALTLEMLEDILSYLDNDVRDIHAKALLSFMFDTMCRTSEVGLFEVQHMQMNKDGSAQVYLPKSKTDQSGNGDWIYISQDTVYYLQKWLEVADIKEGPIFCSVLQDDRIKRKGIMRNTVAKIIKNAGLETGYEGLSGHSLRVGAAVSMAENGIDSTSIARAGRWRSNVMVMRYTKQVDLQNGGIAQLRNNH